MRSLMRPALHAGMTLGAATLLATTTAPAAAQTVTLYGVVDTAVERVGNVGARGDSVWRVPSLTGSLPSRFGLRGSEDLGDGLRAVFTVESGFAPDTGTSTQGGRLFGRQAWVGLAGRYGTVSLGRQYTALFWSLLEADIMGPALYSSGSLDSYIPNARADNAIAYQGRFGSWTVGGNYSLGRDTVNAGPGPAGTNCPGESGTDKQACRQWSLLAKYDSAGFGVATAIDRLHGGAGAFGGLTRSELVDTRIVLNGYVKLGASKLAAGWVRRDNDGSATPRSDLWWLGGAAPRGPWTFEAQVFYLNFRNSDNAALLPTVRTTYRFSRRTALYGSYGYIDNQGALALSVSGGQAGSAPAAGASQSALATGILHTF